MSHDFCDRCGAEINDDECDFSCEESLCPFAIYNDSGKELDFANDIKTVYLPEDIPEYNDFDDLDDLDD